MKGTILLADDNPHTLRMGTEYLSGLGYRVTTAADGGAALAALRQDRPELILVDAALPGFASPLGGMELCRKVKSDPALQSIPVLVLVGALAHLAPAALGGADGSLRKPLSSAGLETWLDRIAAARGARELTPDEMLVLAVQEAARAL
ncbi:MAG: response regulator [Acidobacteria bacterium]|nr:MAG: response regulator [Acidobacteriota bacterium]